MASLREVTEGVQYQGVNEQIVYSITTTPWGTEPTDPSAVLTDPDEEDVSGIMLSGAATLSGGDVIASPIVKNLIAGELYRLAIKFTAGGQVFELYIQIMGED